jgi:hypothetical protein
MFDNVTPDVWERTSRNDPSIRVVGVRISYDDGVT